MEDIARDAGNQDNFIEAEIVGGAHDGQSFQCPADQTCVRFWDGPVPFDYYKLNDKPKFYATSHPAIRGWKGARR